MSFSMTRKKKKKQEEDRGGPLRGTKRRACNAGRPNGSVSGERGNDGDDDRTCEETARELCVVEQRNVPCDDAEGGAAARERQEKWWHRKKRKESWVTTESPADESVCVQ